MSTVYTPLISDLQLPNEPTTHNPLDYGASVAQASSGLASFQNSPSLLGETAPGLNAGFLENAPSVESGSFGSGVLSEVLSGGSPMNLLSPLGGSSATGSPSTGSGGVSRVVSIVLGLLLIGGGLILFRPETVSDVGKIAAA